jgi:hypothetical protein
MLNHQCRCGQAVAFTALECPACGQALGYQPRQRQIVALTDHVACALRETIGCNWLLSDDELAAGAQQCLSCRLTHRIPYLGMDRNLERWRKLEGAKRRMIDGLIALGLPLPAKLSFHFLEDKRSNPLVVDEFVSSGHQGGVITINVAEAEDVYRVQIREEMKEVYRTLLGHFRHEMGHLYWDDLIAAGPWLEPFRALFGDERADYTQALESHYRDGPPADWANNHISSYASCHPHEDWAETWAHYLHMCDAIESAIAHGALHATTHECRFVARMERWRNLTLLLNALSQSVGRQEAYPFGVSPVVERKLAFIDRVINDRRSEGALTGGC